MRGIKGKVFIVAGGARGIGAATAVRLVEEGAKVVVGDINGEGAQAQARALQAKGAGAIGVRFDLADDASCKALADAAWQNFGAVHGLYNCGFRPDNAGDLDVLLTTDAVIKQNLDNNAIGYVRTIRHALPMMLKSGGGTIVSMSSSASVYGEPTRVAYSMSKGAVEALTRHVAARWGKDGIRANSISCGLVVTDAVREALNPEAMAFARTRMKVPDFAKPEDLAGSVVFLLSADSHYANGSLFFFDGGVGLL